LFLVTGNANYNMTSTHLSLMGFTQPELATSVIMDITSTNVGFANRYLTQLEFVSIYIKVWGKQNKSKKFQPGFITQTNQIINISR